MAKKELEKEEIEKWKKMFENIPEENKIVLSERDWNKLMEHLENPPKPTKALVEAMKRYKEEFGDEKE